MVCEDIQTKISVVLDEAIVFKSYISADGFYLDSF